MKANKLTAAAFFLFSFASASILFLIPQNENEVTEEHQSGAKVALDIWTQKRAYPFPDIPADKYYAAYEYSKTFLQPATNQLQSYQWQQIGPHNIGGRTLDVEFNPQNPNTIFAGSASGGLWRSYSAGVGALAWEYVQTGFPVLGVSSIAIAPNDSNTIYIGTGEVYDYQNALGGEIIRTTRGSYGIGILKSTDYGLTWQKSLDWSYNQQRGVEEVEIDPNNPSIIWAATTEGMYKSTDAGQTWNLVHNILMAFDIVINPTNSNIVYVTYGNFFSAGHGIYRTTDGGTSWQKLTNGLPASFGGKALLTIYKSDPQILFASIGNGSTGNGTWLCKTTNGGDNWTIVNTTDYSTYQGWYSHWVGVNPTNSSLVLTGGVDVWKSSNGGSSLTKKTDWSAWYFGTTPPGGPEGPPYYVHADQHSITYHPTNPNIIYFGTDGGVFRTLDGGENYEGCNGGYQTTQFYNGFSSSFDQPNIAIGGMQDNATAIYEGTVAWRRVIGGDGCWTGINSQNTNIIYGTYQYLGLQRSTNLGNSWSYIAPNANDPGFLAPFMVCPSNPVVLYAGSKNVHKSTNQGNNWITMNGNQMLDGNQILSMAVSYNSTDTLYAGTAPINSRANVFVTFNGGTTFQNITGSLPDRYIDDIAVDPQNAAIVYVVISGFGTSHLFKSINAGQSWIDIGAGLPDVPATAVVVDPLNSNVIFFGNDLGVYISLDGGNNWIEYQSGMPDAAMITDLSISLPNHRIRAVTHGRGVFEADIDYTVPVELVSFNAFVSGGNVNLEWKTATETNNNLFEIERRQTNKYDWSVIGFRKGAGTTTEAKSYSFIDENLSAGDYQYRLKQIDFDGSFEYSNIIDVEIISPSGFVLAQNYPNPFNPTTIIKYTIPFVTLRWQSHRQAQGYILVSLKVYDVLGNEAAALVNALQPAGNYEVEFDASKLSSGVYYYQLKAGDFVETKKMILLR